VAAADVLVWPRWTTGRFLNSLGRGPAPTTGI